MPSVRTGDFDCWYASDCFVDPWLEPETILIQHGFGRTGRYWNRWVPDLAKHYRVIRRDLRGHGGSTDTGPDYVHFVGESVGGPTDIALAVHHPERLRSLTIVSGVLRLGEPVQRLFRGSYPDWPSARRSEWDRAPAHVLEGLARLTSHVEVEPLLAQVKVPTLILAPADSNLPPLRDPIAMREQIPDARIEVFEGHGHGFYPAEAERCTAAVLRFLHELSARRGGGTHAAQ